MGAVIPFPAQRTVEFDIAERIALDRLVRRLRSAGAVGWEVETGPGLARAYVTGAEDETLLIVSKSGAGISVTSGYAHRLLWRGDTLERYA